MKLAYSPTHENLRQELRAYYDRLLTPDGSMVRRTAGAGASNRTPCDG